MLEPLRSSKVKERIPFYLLAAGLVPIVGLLFCCCRGNHAPATGLELGDRLPRPPRQSPAPFRSAIQFELSYHFEAPATYQDVRVRGSQLTLTYCFVQSQNAAQIPLWRKDDLRTMNVVLLDSEVSNLENLVMKSGFMDLDSVCGAGVYNYRLTARVGVKRHRVDYRECPSISPAPEPFRAVRAGLADIVKRKFDISL